MKLRLGSLVLIVALLSGCTLPINPPLEPSGTSASPESSTPEPTGVWTAAPESAAPKPSVTPTSSAPSTTSPMPRVIDAPKTAAELKTILAELLEQYPDQGFSDQAEAVFNRSRDSLPESEYVAAGKVFADAVTKSQPGVSTMTWYCTRIGYYDSRLAVPVLALGAIRYDAYNCWDRLEVAILYDEAFVGSWKTAVKSYRTSMSFDEQKLQKLAVPYNLGSGKLPGVAKKIPSGGSNPGKGFLIVKRDLTRDKALAIDKDRTQSLSLAEIAKLATNTGNLKTLIVVDTTWKDVSDKYRGSGKVLRCVETVYGYNVKQKKSFSKKSVEGYLQLSVNTTGGVGYLDCPANDKTKPIVDSIIKSLK